jgi:hypothetical protein
LAILYLAGSDQILNYLDVRTEEVADGSEGSGNIVGAQSDPDGLEITGWNGHLWAAALV